MFIFLVDRQNIIYVSIKYRNDGPDFMIRNLNVSPGLTNSGYDWVCELRALRFFAPHVDLLILFADPSSIFLIARTVCFSCPKVRSFTKPKPKPNQNRKT